MRSSVDRAENAFFAVPPSALRTTGELGQTPRNDGLLIITKDFVLNVPWCMNPSVGDGTPRDQDTPWIHRHFCHAMECTPFGP